MMLPVVGLVALRVLDRSVIVVWMCMHNAMTVEIANERGLFAVGVLTMTPWHVVPVDRDSD